MPTLGEVVSQFGQSIRGQSAFRRFMAFVVTMAVAGAFLYVGSKGGVGNYTALYSNLPPEEGSAVVEHLKTANVKYRLEDDGRTIKVPQESVAELRMQLAQQNLPTAGGPGFEYFEKPPLGMTDQVQQIMYVNSLKNELARSISTLKAVERARVILAVPERSSFLRTEESKPTASVVLELAAGASLSPGNVDGILNLVSHAVEGLTPENIALVDARTGQSLNKGKGTAEDAAADQNLAFQARYEDKIERDIESMLENVVGKGGAVARVRADFDFKRTTTQKRSYDDDAKAVESETVEYENVAVRGDGTAGSSYTAAMPSTGSGVREMVSAGAVQPGPNGSLHSRMNYKVSQTDTTTVEPLATLRQLTAAVMVNNSRKAPDPANAKKTIDKTLTEEDLAQLTKLVQSAVGYTADRSDSFSINVESVPFVKPETIADDVNKWDAAQRQQLIRHEVEWGIYGLLGILAVFFLIRPLLQALAAVLQGHPARRSLVIAGSEDEMRQLHSAGEGGLSFPSASDARRMLGRAEAGATNKQVDDLVRRDPAKAAALIRTWLEGK